MLIGAPDLPSSSARCVVSFCRNGLWAATWDIDRLQQNALWLSAERRCRCWAVFTCGSFCHSWTGVLVGLVCEDGRDQEATILSVVNSHTR